MGQKMTRLTEPPMAIKLAEHCNAPALQYRGNSTNCTRNYEMEALFSSVMILAREGSFCFPVARSD